MMPPINFQTWIEENRHLLKPPVSNKVIHQGKDFIVMVVGGPNERTDFHVNQTEEWFYQLEGTIFLRTINEAGKFEDIHLQAGDVFLLPAGVPHSPQRSAGSIGLVIERIRGENYIDKLQWYCKSCQRKLYEESFHLKNIEKDFGAVFDRYYNSEFVKCSCGTVNGRMWS
ncbi:MAG: 3-hydroxyanthranilate 3,4-dioxygenase [Bacteriovoracia bacterium]